MKKVVLVLSFLTVGIAAKAQFSFGAKVGFNLCGLSPVTSTAQGVSGTISSNKMADGFYVGGFVGYAFNKWIGLRPEVVFSTQGSTIDNNATINRLHYLNIPLLVNFSLPIPIDIMAGPQVGFLTTGLIRGEKVGVERYDFALVCGVDYRASEHVRIGIRYNGSITPSVNGTISNISSVTVRGARNRVFQMGITWIP